MTARIVFRTCRKVLQRTSTALRPAGILKRPLTVAAACSGCAAGVAAAAVAISARPSPLIHCSTISKASKHPMNFFADVVERVSPAVVHIQFAGRVGTMFGWTQVRGGGSGVIVSEDGLIITNAHVVMGAHTGTQVEVTLSDGRKFKGKVVAYDSAADLAAVRLVSAPNSLPRLPLASDTPLCRPGEWVMAVGSPFLILSNSVTVGVVSNAKRRLNEIGFEAPIEYIQTDAAINQGNSGGPLVNLNGELLGICAMKVAEGEGVSFAVPASVVQVFIANVTEYEKRSEPRPDQKKSIFSGIFGARPDQKPMPPFGISYYELDDANGGVIVHSVTVGSIAHRAGLRPGDIITEINGVSVESGEQVEKVLRSSRHLRMTIERHGGTMRVEVRY